MVRSTISGILLDVLSDNKVIDFNIKVRLNGFNIYFKIRSTFAKVLKMLEAY